MRTIFQPPPDAFKRVAALLVTMSLYPFIIGRRENSKGLFVEVLQGDSLRYFGICSLIDALMPYFAPFQQQNNAMEWVQMDQWPGFAQEETRNELTYLLYCYSKSGILEFKDRELTYQALPLYQAILSTSLTLKCAYSLGNGTVDSA